MCILSLVFTTYIVHTIFIIYQIQTWIYSTVEFKSQELNKQNGIGNIHKLFSRKRVQSAKN